MAIGRHAKNTHAHTNPKRGEEEEQRVERQAVAGGGKQRRRETTRGQENKKVKRTVTSLDVGGMGRDRQNKDIKG